MDFEPLKSAMRAALSHGEKAETLSRESKEAFAAGAIDSAHYETVRTFYETQLASAEQDIAWLRKEAGQRLADLQHAVRRELNEQARILDSVRRGRLEPHAANDANRAVLARLAQLKTAINEVTRIFQATDSESLGGFIDLPLEQYATEKAYTYNPQRTKNRTRLLYGLAAASVVIVIGVSIFWLMPGISGIPVEISVVDEQSSTMRFSCRNTGSAPIAFYAPWPQGKPQPDSGFVLGTVLYVRETGTTEFRLVTVSDACWNYQGAPVSSGEAIMINPGLSVSVLMDARKLRDIGLNADSFRIEFTDADGTVLKTIEPKSGN